MFLVALDHCSRRGQFTIVPVLVGSLSPDKERLYGSIFSHYLADPENFFVVSSDFCHWGQRFRYTFYDKSCGDIWQSIEALDKMVTSSLFCLFFIYFMKLIWDLSYQGSCCIWFLPASPKMKAGLGVQSLRSSVRPSVCPKILSSQLLWNY